MNYILIIATSYAYFLPGGKTVQEFSSREACMVALVEAKRAYATVNSESKCVSVKEAAEKIKLEQDLKDIKSKLRDM